MASTPTEVSDAGGNVLRRSRLARVLASEVSEAIEVAEDAAIAAFPERMRPVPRDPKLASHQTQAANAAADLAAAVDQALSCGSAPSSTQLDRVESSYQALRAVHGGAEPSVSQVVTHTRAVWAEFDDSGVAVSWVDFAQTLDNRLNQGERP